MSALAQENRKRVIRRLIASATLLIIFAFLFILLSVFTDTFFTKGNLYNLLRQTSINGIVAIGMTFVIISGGIDLSVGAVVGFSGIIASVLMTRHGVSPLPACAIAIVGGSILGIFNGILIYEGKIPPFIATLGVMTMIRGSLMLISGARNISGLPKEFRQFSQRDFFSLPMLFWVWLAIIVLGIFITRKTVFGRRVYALGSNAEAARLSGINLRWVYYGTYALCAFLCAVAGILYASRLGNGVPTAGQGYELDAIAAAVIGGASLSGAEGTILGTVLGTIIMAMLRNGGNLLGIDPFILEITVGGLIVTAAFIDQQQKAKGRR